MRSLARFVLVIMPLLLLIAWGASMLLERLQVGWVERDIGRRSTLLFSSIDESLSSLISENKIVSVKKLLNRVSEDDLLYGVLVCPDLAMDKSAVAAPISNSGLSPSVTCSSLAPVADSHTATFGALSLYIWRFQLAVPSTDHRATVYVLNDATLWLNRGEKTRFYLVALFVAVACVVVLAATWVAKWTLSRPLQDMRVFIKEAVRFGDPRRRLQSLAKTEFAPLVKDLLGMTRELQRLKMRSVSANEGGIWSSELLRSYVESALERTKVFVIANREPFIHMNKEPNEIEVLKPASGLVTGVEPILKACKGTWIAHGSGSADKGTVDANDCISVPPEAPEYTLRRVWMSPEEEQGYYYGFSNEGLWPLCHIAHQRPKFDDFDWDSYRAVNQRFADAFLKQSKGKPSVVLIQDYHFALLPKLIRNVSPQSLILLFWHIPWPNPEAFGICPWRQDILEGMLAADVLGFHTQFHCNNFIDTVDRFVEARIDREHFSVQYQRQECRIRPFPISIEWNSSTSVSSESIRVRHGLSEDSIVAVGVDRVDYTKGLIERVMGVRRFAQRRPDLAQRFSFIQIGAPSRIHIPVYKQLNDELVAVVAKVNAEFRESLGRDLIILKLHHHNSADLQPYYEQANMALVSPLHDGMNLVAKEFVASRRSENGVLLLSQFAGASRELREALIINPYRPDDIASKLIAACEMPLEEQRDRMRRMRSSVMENNVFKWAYLQLKELSDVRQMRDLGMEG